MHRLIHRHTISFKHAFEGLFWAFRTQPNFKIHAILSFIACCLGVILQISRLEFIVILFTIILGFSGELINTALEAMTDLITQEWRQEAKIAKDVSAGMMLFIAFGSIFVAVFVFTPYILKFVMPTG
jgi:diacylglycerol kinase (ATP)